MANFVVNHAVKAYTPETIMVSGRFAPNGGNAPTIPDSGKNRGWTVARTDTGDFTITFANFKWLALESFTAWAQSADATVTIVQGADWDNSAGTMQLTILQESAGTFAAADIGPDANDVIHFQATFRTASV